MTTPPPAPLFGADMPPSPWVVRFLAAAPAGGAVLDLACGAGRHTRLAAGLGHPVTAIDRAPGLVAALADVAAVSAIVADLESGAPLPVPPRHFGAVIVTNYLFRPLFPAIAAAVAPAGVLIYETFAVGHERPHRPFRPEFLLGPNELLPPVLAAGLVVVAFEQGERPPLAGGAPAIVQRLAAVGPEHPWAGSTPRALDG
jgi:SAM-dependent methyltransferase